MSEVVEPFDTDLDSLDCIFYLPEHLHGEDMRYFRMYEVLKHKLQKEALGLPLDTMQQVLLERITLLYVTIRYREDIPMGNEGGFENPSEAKRYNDNWMAMVQEWNKIMRSSPLEERQQLMQSLLTDVTKSLRTLDLRPEDKTKMVNKLSTDLEKAGWTV